MHANIDVNRRIFIAKFPIDGIKCIEKCNHIVQTWPLLIKVDMTGLYNKWHIKEGNLQSITSRGFKIHMLYQFQ